MRHSLTPFAPRLAAPCHALLLSRRHPAQDGQLPLHLAIANKAPDAVVLALLERHQGAAEEKDVVRTA